MLVFNFFKGCHYEVTINLRNFSPEGEGGGREGDFFI